MAELDHVADTLPLSGERGRWLAHADDAWLFALTWAASFGGGQCVAVSVDTVTALAAVLEDALRPLRRSDNDARDELTR